MGENKPTAEEFVSLKESVLIIITNILNSASSLKLIPIKILMDKKAYISNKTKSPEPGPLSESISSETPYLPSPEYPYETNRTSSAGRRRWAESVHVLNSIRMFESYSHNPFYSLIFSLRCFGLSIRFNSEDSKIFTKTQNPIRQGFSAFGRYSLTGFMLIYILYHAIRTTLTVAFGGIWTNLKVLMNAWILLFTIILFLIRHNQIGALMVHIQSIEALVKDHISPLKRKVMITIGCVWIYLAIAVFTFFVDFSYEKAEDLFLVNFGHLEVPPEMISIILYIDTVLNVYFVRGPLIFTIVLYILLCHSLKHLFKDLKQFSIIQQKQKRRLTLKELIELRHRHQLLAVYSEELDYIFSLSVFLWCIRVFISLCTRVNTLIAGEYSSANIEGWVSSVWGFGITLLIFTGVSLSASSLVCEANHSALKIEQLATFQMDNIEDKFYFELLSFNSSISLSPVQLTCYRFFLIRKHFMLIIAFIVIVYSLFAVHFNYIEINSEHKSI